MFPPSERKCSIEDFHFLTPTLAESDIVYPENGRC